MLVWYSSWPFSLAPAAKKITTAANMGTVLGWIRQRLQQKIITLVSLGTVLGWSHQCLRQRSQQMLPRVQFLAIFISACSEEENNSLGTVLGRIPQCLQQKITTGASLGSLQQSSQQLSAWTQISAVFIGACGKDHKRCYTGHKCWPFLSVPAAKISTDVSLGTNLSCSQRRFHAHTHTHTHIHQFSAILENKIMWFMNTEFKEQKLTEKTWCHLEIYSDSLFQSVLI